MMIGYARVSTWDQKLDLQRQALRAAGCERIFEDTAGAAAERPALREAPRPAGPVAQGPHCARRASACAA